MGNIHSELTVEQKMTKAMLALRKIRPFYAAIYENLEKEIVNEPGYKAAVNVNKLKYNPKFIDELDFSEVLFLLLHEIVHVALMHSVRLKGHEIKLWNMACDLYVNKMLATEFNIGVKGEKNVVEGYEIKAVNGAYYNPDIDLEKDYVEKIYEKLFEQAYENGYIDAVEKGDKTSRFTFEYTSEGTKAYGGAQSFYCNINTDTSDADLIDDGKEESVKRQEAEKIISESLVKAQIIGAGREPSKLERLASEVLQSKIDWKSLLKKYLIKVKSADSTFSNPDKRMFYTDNIHPGRGVEDGEVIKGVKVCIDTSGSISDTDLKHFCGQVLSLTKQYKIEAELIYWDTEVQSVGNMTNYTEFERIDCYGGGGTQPEAVFKYLSSKKCKTPAAVVLMFTDGYFFGAWDTVEMRKKYKNTIWIMTRDYNKDFKPPFGKLAFAKFE